MGLTLPPTASKGGPLGQYAGPSSLFAVNARCSNKSRAVEFVNWFVNDPKPWSMLKLISGPPASHKALADMAKTKLSPSERLVLAYTQTAAKVAKPAPPPPPKSNTQVTDLFQRTNQDISFGKQTLAAGVSSFMSQSKSLMLQ
jgi:multiple sugar transport system substrate-binding protein